MQSCHKLPIPKQERCDRRKLVLLTTTHSQDWRQWPPLGLVTTIKRGTHPFAKTTPPELNWSMMHFRRASCQAAQSKLNLLYIVCRRYSWPAEIWYIRILHTVCKSSLVNLLTISLADDFPMHLLSVKRKHDVVLFLKRQGWKHTAIRLK